MQGLMGVGIGIFHHHWLALLCLEAKGFTLFQNRTDYSFGILVGHKVQVQISLDGFNP